jgi:type I restriction enzyme S subunit
MREKLINICTPRQWKTLSTSELKDEGYTVYGANGVIGYYNEYNHEVETVMVTCRGATCGTVNISKPYSYVNGNAMCMDDLRHDINVKYLYYALRNYDFKEVISGSAQPQITRQGLNNVFVEVVDKPRQLEIVKVLSKVEETISRKQQQLSEYDQLIKSRFVEMFGDPIENPLNWNLQPLSYLGSLDRGKSKHRPRNAPELLGGEYPLIQTGDVANSDLYITEYSSTYSELGLKQSKMWNPGTLCITIAANIAKTAILKFKACFPDSVVGFIPNDQTNNIFIHYWFSFFQKVLEKQAPESAQKNINLGILKDLQVFVPSINLQNDFSQFVNQIDKLKFEVQKSLDETQKLFDSLMQEYFG